MGLSVLEVQSILDQISYKPGWYFDANQPHYAKKVMRIDLYARSIDSGDLKGTVTITHKWQGELFTKKQILKAVKQLIKETEGHEFHEFFKFKGKHIKNPHPSKKRSRT